MYNDLSVIESNAALGRLYAFSHEIRNKLPYCSDEKTIAYLKKKQEEIDQLMEDIYKGLIVYENQGFFAESEKLSDVLRSIPDNTVCISKRVL